MERLHRLLLRWSRRRVGAFIFSICLAAGGNPVFAEDASQKALELEQLRSRIHALQGELETTQKEKSRTLSSLRQIERHISQVRRALQRIDRDLDRNNLQLNRLREQKKAEKSKVEKQRKRLAAEARAAYAMGRQQQVKLLLNQEQPEAVGRMLAYFGYFSRARMQRIEIMQSTLQDLRILEDSIQRKTRVMTELRRQQHREADTLREQQRNRQQILVQLNTELESRGGELERLKTDEQRLQKLVYSLQELLADIPSDANQQRPFKSLKGKLLWPTKGRLAIRFGSQRGASGLKWQGVLIAAPEGGEVRAVSQGRVAFADWMRGFGLLLIIDHGDGYMSLYGHNQALYKEVGEWVDTGEVVAMLGASGGQVSSGLYFELRYKGQPINPLRWCAGKPVPVSG